MEALVYEDSPLADYLEGEGQGDENWAPQTDSPTDDFAPKGPPKIQDRIRNKLPAPLRLNGSSKAEALAKVQQAFAAAIRTRIGKGDNERFREQFGYTIIASQLLNEQTPPSHTAVTASLAKEQRENVPSDSRPTSHGIRGAAYTTLAAFSVVALLHWARSWSKVRWDTKRVFLLVFLLAVVAISFYIFAKRQWLRDLRHQAVDVATVLVGNAQSLDAAASASVVLIQEVELVSRGYRISTPMPPVSRLEDQSQLRRCSKLRHVLSECLVEMLERYLDAKRKLRPLVEEATLMKYYDIYDFSPEELEEAESALADLDMDDKTSLRSLRALFTRLYSVRKCTLCCLLALPADGADEDVTSWSVAVEEMRRLASTTGTCLQRLTDILNEQDQGDSISPSPRPRSSPARDRHRAQLRRLNSLSQGIRGLHAKMHLIREESDACLERSAESLDLSSTLISQYESIGTDLRGLLQEWEAGKSTLLANLEKPDRMSRTPSMIRSPVSPTFSIGGSTAVDGSPSAALRALNGENNENAEVLSPDRNLDDDEVFEAVALPRKRNPIPREERIARMEEDRARRTSMRERADVNTNMLRELETVINLRPNAKSGARVTTL